MLDGISILDIKTYLSNVPSEGYAAVGSRKPKRVPLQNRRRHLVLW
jgi:hypothetical protein